MALDPKKFSARFVQEAREHLHRLEEGLAALQANPSDQETVNTIFRSAHTIKGSSRMLKFGAINETAHKLEDVLDALRSGKRTYAPELGRLIQRAGDAISALVENIAEDRDPGVPDPALCAELAQAAAGEAQPGTEAPVTPVAPPAPAATHAPVHLKSPDTVRISMSKLDELIKLMGEVVTSHARQRQRVADVRALERNFADLPGAALAAPWGASLREFVRNLKDDVLVQELLMEELHTKALIMRMLPLGMVFDEAPRMVRELGRSIGKEIECTISGMEIELDRQLIDRLGDPILHLLRNAADHGIEDASARLRAGKPKQGRIRLSARQDAGGVIVEVSDDGAGLSLDAIRDRAIRKGMMSADQAGVLSDAEVVDLIFLPGFSTSSIITDISGRGVGMDVVKRCVVEELQGTININSRLGFGTTFTLRLPLSLAMMRVLLVEAGGEIFGFTAQQVAHLLRLPAERIMTVAERQVVVVDNEFIPVVGLAELLSRPGGRYAQTDNLLMVVVHVRNEKLALAIDELIDEGDMVIKPLPAHLSHLTMVSGMVMTGKNALISVLHAPTLLEMARKSRSQARKTEEAVARTQTRILVVDDSLNTREIEKDVLEAHGYQVTLAEDGRDGLFKARNGEFDAILTDVEMPNMDGFSLTIALRQEERYRAVPIIIITSRQKEEDRRRGIEVGADAYIVKGDFDQSSLIDTLKSIIG